MVIYTAFLIELITIIIIVLIKNNKLQEQGLNKIPSPQHCPTWLCCLLPCLRNSRANIKYNEAMADFAEVRRDKVWRRIDPFGVLVGDLIRVTEGNRVPADVRVLERGIDCVIDTSTITGKVSKKREREILPTGLEADIVCAGCLCVTGFFVGVVIAIGAKTMIGKLITHKRWPVEHHIGN